MSDIESETRIRKFLCNHEIREWHQSTKLLQECVGIERRPILQSS